MATGPNGKDIAKRAREIRQRLEEIEKQLDGKTTDQPATETTSAADQSDQAFEYDPDCPACLRSRRHTREEHEQALARVAQASNPNAPDDEGSMF